MIRLCLERRNIADGKADTESKTGRARELTLDKIIFARILVPALKLKSMLTLPLYRYRLLFYMPGDIFHSRTMVREEDLRDGPCLETGSSIPSKEQLRKRVESSSAHFRRFSHDPRMRLMVYTVFSIMVGFG